MQTKAALGTVVVLVALAGLYFAMSSGSDTPEPDDVVEVEREARRPGSQRSGGVSEGEGEQRRRSRRGDRPLSESELVELRAERERHVLERFRRDVQITSLGNAPVTLTAEALREAMRAGEAAFEDCIEASGGREVYRRALRDQQIASGDVARQEALAPGTPDARRRGRKMQFDIRPDGRVAPDSIVFTPEVPAPFDACFRAHIDSVRVDEVGRDGARVDMPARGPRRVVGEDGQRQSGDGGVY